MEKYLQNWSITRIIQLIFGAIVLYYGLYYSSFFLIILGAGFFIQGILNTGCANGNCKRY